MSNPIRTATTALLGLAAAAAGGALLLSAPEATAAALAPSTVTIQAEGTDLFGKVNSTRALCKADRNVIVYKQVGVRGGGNDIRFAMDTTDSDGDWNTGNTGTEGRFYAKVTKNSQCNADFSPTIRATR
ncbi:hypothetical protein [Nocardioides bizhenqiangii]|uniref:Secreted protein n=1 Tax=Nocardioides bizhenqiangii TaxID=3095076 RepID=A0ABZ0ZVI9_9ACTN|nr:hypothetical protein [Nocardioides sp. HM61]WQQ27841.1 hypothetical protein SHK19_06310 [Nocardioides sp. HM61]